MSDIGEAGPSRSSTASHFDATIGDVIYKHHVRGEKFIAIRTDLLQRYPFPGLKGTNFIPEAQVLLRVPGLVRCINEPLRRYYRDEADNLTGSKWRHSWRGMLYYYGWLLLNHPYYFVISAWRALARRLAR